MTDPQMTDVQCIEFTADDVQCELVNDHAGKHLAQVTEINDGGYVVASLRIW